MLASSLLAPLLLPLASAAAVLTRADKPPAFFLAGDSTTAANGGYGDDFLSFLTNEAWGANYAKSGASTVSFKADGNWAALMKMVHENLRDNQVFVTIEVSALGREPRQMSQQLMQCSLGTMTKSRSCTFPTRSSRTT